ncbi:protease HtpX [Shewanella oneidensis MR-1]|uniref:Protease HtpX n=1 Tax=Shewanella oneidensis (strain ATCC 700550 / JCM 31522 / CIP 106686 / LMG 19005 / NCIMB 14063 / MR-1) TaxID=211586 RepID=HTPX_SHEON|nr:protease HtpX [Shewanella oneidensis]Q8EDL5.1 RecName: Full=Protease HtpX; AltName: Full=Heat shock protein HtpX [Shewanella oneidensis MR-1]AAN55756.1 Zn-dependent metalloprotease HtpX [Shewanella oneidensis MR-1]MDX5995605.1 protease HtpX [Shewanella oneidensis]MEE2026344.1 Protease HtpX [Shewanella oneidensis]QKG97226.1 protease HtpX [Shewanella oneidensis MR-1]
MKRIFLLIVTNLAVLLVASIVMSILGVNTSTMGGLLVFAAIFGFGGAFISLAISKWMAKKTMGCEVITTPRDSTERWLLDTVARQAQQAGIKMPEVAIYQSPEMNAFATGPSKDNSLVAVSTGLLYGMSQDEIEGVLAHEVSHVANGDMVTLTLIQGVVNTFVIFAARVVAGIINNFVSSNDEEGEGLGMFAYMAVVFVLDMLFGILASIIVAYFSRIREYRADEGAARLAGKNKMIAALERLRQGPESSAMPAQMSAFGINGKRSMAELMMSHPPLEKRIAALQSR